MYPLPNNNFNGIALALMRDAVRVNSITVDVPRPEGINLFYSPPRDSDHASTYYLRRQKLVDGRVLDVEFHDTFFSYTPLSGHHSLEIKLKPSETNPVGFETEEKGWTHLGLGKLEGLYSWLAHIGDNPLLKMFRQYNGPNKWVNYSPQERKKSVIDNEKGDHNHGDSSALEIEKVNTKYHRLASEVLAVLGGESDTITVS